ncbi:MAG: monovalent cation/H+ antiporter subunit D family protein [Gammaproteobacteria bacterium]|nr:monovalent cation/H+ antiporter subunit D family protein [Gammaproteobacteria bacterium]
MIAAHYPILQVVIPLIAAPLCSLLPRSRLPWMLATSIAWISFAISIFLIFQVNANGTLSYELGSWPAPWGIQYYIDTISAFVLVLVTAIAAITLLASRQLVENEIDSSKHSLFYTAFLLCLTGLLGIVATGDAFNVFVFLEISSLSSYAMIAMGDNRKALTASYEYLIMGTIGATFILIGIGLLYMQTGTLNMLDLKARIHDVDSFRSVHAAFAFFTVGICLKLALFPLHHWLPNAYAHAPSVVSIFLAATATKVALYLLYRVFYTIFGFDFSFSLLHLGYILLPLSIIAIVISAFTAIFQPGVKRLLAYSSLGQIGYMTMGISLETKAGLIASIIHLFNHAFIKGALFMCMACIIARIHSTRLEHLAGVGRVMPWTSAAFVIAGLALIGVPLTSGFISKWYLVLAILEKDYWWLALIVLFTSLLSVIYIWRVIEQMYFREPNEGYIDVKEAPPLLLTCTWVMVLITLYFGIDTRYPVEMATAAAQALLK